MIDFQKSIDNNSKDGRKELKENLESFQNSLNDALKDYKERLREQFGEFKRINALKMLLIVKNLGILKIR